MELNEMQVGTMLTKRDLARVEREVNEMIAQTRRADARGRAPGPTNMVLIAPGVEAPAIPAPKAAAPKAKAPKAAAEPRSLTGPRLRREDFQTNYADWKQLRDVARKT